MTYEIPWCLSGKESNCQCRRGTFNSWVRKIPWRRKWPPTSIFLPRKPHGERSLADYSPSGYREWDTTWWLNNINTDIRCRISLHMVISHWYIYILVRCLLRSSVHFILWLFIFTLLSFECSLYILQNSPLSDLNLQIFFLSRWLDFSFSWQCFS